MYDPFLVPENDKGIQKSRRIDVEAGTRSKARGITAFMAYGFIRGHGLWINLKDAGLIPSLDSSINQLQELYQKKYLDEAPKKMVKHVYWCSIVLPSENPKSKMGTLY